MVFSFAYPFPAYSFATGETVLVSPTISGSIPPTTTFVISSTLPAGLSINPANGTISGTTTFSSISSPITYRVDASTNTVIAGTTNITISVNYVPVFSYVPSSYILKKGEYVLLRPIYRFSNQIGIIYSSSPDLGNIGLELNSENGYISGTPNVLSDLIEYIIDADNNGIHYPTTIIIGVQNPPTITYAEPIYTLIQNVPVTILPNQVQLQSNVIYDFSGCYLPIGLSFNIYTGEISGIPLVLTTARAYTISVSNDIGSSFTSLGLIVQREILAPPVLADNFSTNTFLTDPAIAMRRKAEILKYKKNSNPLTQRQNFAQSLQGRGTTFKRTWNPLACPNPGLLCAPTSSSDVPGPVMNLCYNPNVGLVGYNQPNRKRVDIGFKWPQRSWQAGDNGFPNGKAGSG